MRFTRSSGQTALGPEDWFTGTVFIDGIRNPDEQSAVGCAHVRFTPGARTNWHSHAVGQTLHLTEGVGLVGTRDGQVVRVRAGDTVICPPGEEHWHGAAADNFMIHLAMLEARPDGGDPTTCLEPVPQDEYVKANHH